MSTTKKKNTKKNAISAQSFGARLKNALEIRSISVNEVCKTIGLSDVTIYKYLNDQTLPTLDKADEIGN